MGQNGPKNQNFNILVLLIVLGSVDKKFKNNPQISFLIMWNLYRLKNLAKGAKFVLFNSLGSKVIQSDAFYYLDPFDALDFLFISEARLGM